MENDYADVYYVDTRNADARDHRTHTATGNRPNWVPTPPARTVYVPPSAYQRPMAAYPSQMGYASAPMIYTVPPQPTIAATLFGKLTTGQVVEMVAQLFAALQPLPSSPVATRETSVDVGNLILFQGALAQHAKRDEQIRTLGSLVGKVVG